MKRVPAGWISIVSLALVALTGAARADEPKAASATPNDRPSVPNAFAFRGNGPFELTWSYARLASEPEGLQFGFGVDAHVVAFAGPMSIHGEAGLGFTPALTCKEEGEDGCGAYGRIRAEAALGPAFALERRTRLFVRAGAAAGLEGHPAYGLGELYAPRFELGFATWRPIGPAPTLPNMRALIFTDLALTGALLVGATAGSSVENAPRNGTLGATSFTVVGPASLELRVDVSPDRAWVIGRSRVCAGIFGIACASFESLHAHVIDQNDGKERDMNGASFLVAVGGGGAFAIE